MKIESYAFNADVTWDQWARNQCMLIAQHHGIELKEDEIQNWLATELGEDEETPPNSQLLGAWTWARCDGNSVPKWPDWMVEPDISAIIILGHPEITLAFLEELVIREKNYARPFCHKDWGDTNQFPMGWIKATTPEEADPNHCHNQLGMIPGPEIMPNAQFPLGCSNLEESEYCTHWFKVDKLGDDPQLPTIPGQEGWIIAYRNCYCS